eukprot:jgi/Bigna1/60598/fgenesh1_kg.13_\
MTNSAKSRVIYKGIYAGRIPRRLEGRGQKTLLRSEKERVHLGEELSDVLIYLVRLADRCQIDLASAARRKMEQNALKYPADKAKGRSDKYTAYEEKAASKESKSGTGKVKSETEGLTKGNQVSNKNSTSWMSSGSFLIIFAAIAVYVVIYLAVGH